MVVVVVGWSRRSGSTDANFSRFETAATVGFLVRPPRRSVDTNAVVVDLRDPVAVGFAFGLPFLAFFLLFFLFESPLSFLGVSRSSRELMA